MSQKVRKVGYLRVVKLQFPRIDQRRLGLPSAAVDLQSRGLSMAIFSYVLKHEFAIFFQIKRPLFSKKIQICLSLKKAELPANSPKQSRRSSIQDPTPLDNSRPQGVTNHCFVSGNWTFCSVFWALWECPFEKFSSCKIAEKMVVFVS